MFGCLVFENGGSKSIEDWHALIDSDILITKYRGDIISITFQVFFRLNLPLNFFPSTSHVSLVKVIFITLDKFFFWSNIQI